MISDRPTRNAALESLKKFLSRPRDMPLIEFEKLWKGLYFAMWFSDRPRPQQRLAADLGQLFLVVPEKNFYNFALAFWKVIAREWVGIDHHRLDKFLLLVRRVLFYQLKRLSESQWDSEMVTGFLNALKKSPLSGDNKVPTGITYHLIDIYADEVERMMFEELEDDEEEEEEKKQEIIDQTPLQELIEPFVTLSKECLLKTIREKIKDDLLGDDRLTQWNVTVSAKINEDKQEQEDEDEDDDEWHGFD